MMTNGKIARLSCGYNAGSINLKASYAKIGNVIPTANTTAAYA